MTEIQNTDAMTRDAYKIARTVFAQTNATSLAGVEALTSMIQNVARKTGRKYSTIVSDATIFDAYDENSPRHANLNANTSSRGFQMCLRVAMRMLNGTLADACNGATRYHHCDRMPSWAVSIGYIADIDEMLFYV